MFNYKKRGTIIMIRFDFMILWVFDAGGNTLQYLRMTRRDKKKNDVSNIFKEKSIKSLILAKTKYLHQQKLGHIN